MKAVQEFFLETVQAFTDAGKVNARRQAEELFCDLLGCDRLHLYTRFDQPLTESECSLCQDWVNRRLHNEPLAYVHGKVHFYGCTLKVNRSVLIPRQETEILVDKIVKCLKFQDLTGKVLWDLCCGSGCIGIALKKTFPELQVYAGDCSQEALDLTASNADANGVEVICRKGDLLTPFQGQKTDYFVCNPPYVTEQEYEALDREVRDYEPRLALVGGKTGLEYYERLARELPLYLRPHAQGWLEIGYNQGEAVQKLFDGHCWKKHQLENDWAGHNRFFFLEIE